eukprot:SAG22_NODE_13369_length_409_cov_0.832258_1_plen_67_part_01
MKRANLDTFDFCSSTDPVLAQVGNTCNGFFIIASTIIASDLQLQARAASCRACAPVPVPAAAQPRWP